jgi:predicted nucleic acid-binding protein
VLIIDTGVLLATADRNDPDHLACRDLLETDDGPLVTTAMVIAEAGYLINRQVGAVGEAALYETLIDGTLTLETLTTTDWQRVHDLVVGYADLQLGGTDASLITIAERLNATRVATLDRRHFGVVRPTHTDAFDLLP